MAKDKKAPKKGQEHGNMPHTRRSNDVKRENAFSAPGLATKIKRRKELYDVE